MSKFSSLGAALKAKSAELFPHIAVKAGAGCGKTSTAVEGLKYSRGMPVAFDPSEQQVAIWESMKPSGTAKHVAFCSFNRAIKIEFAKRVPEGVDATTFHSFGGRIVTSCLGKLDLKERNVEDIIKGFGKVSPHATQAAASLVSLCKANLTDPTPENLANLADDYQINVGNFLSEIVDVVPRALEECTKAGKDRDTFDFDDMVWLPIALGLPIPPYDFIVIDETQDLNRCQQALAKKSGKRLMLVGDTNQAIYAFAGADHLSMPRLIKELSESKAGCETYPLNVTRRCGLAIVEEARKVVKDFHAHPSNGAGKVSYARYDPSMIDGKTYRDDVKPGDMILCRNNGPLVNQCFKFLAEDRRATIQGRDVGTNLIKTISRIMQGRADTIPELIKGSEEWLERQVAKENAKKNPSESRLQSLEDRFNCIQVLAAAHLKTATAVKDRIAAIFTDNRDDLENEITLSSIHRAKGLERRRVFFLMPKGAECPSPRAKGISQKQQERNLLYVGITRAIEELIYVR